MVGVTQSKEPVLRDGDSDLAAGEAALAGSIPGQMLMSEERNPANRGSRQHSNAIAALD